MRKESFKIEDRICIAYTNELPKFVLIQPVDRNDLEFIDHQIDVITSMAKESYLLVAFNVNNWNDDLSPWKTSGVLGKINFGDNAKNTLCFIEEKLLPCIYQKYLFHQKLPIILGGYSLAAFFSLWSAYQSDTFTAIASASPSVWFPEWIGYANTHLPKSKYIYLSLGDKEEKTRNKIMATVGDCIRAQMNILKKQEINTILEWNEGNHFKDTAIRIARGFAWCINSINKQ